MVDESRGNCLSDTARMMQIWTHRNCDNMYQTCTCSDQTKSQNSEGEVCSNPTIYNWYLLGKENQFSPREYPWAYLPHFKVGFVRRCNWQTQNVLYGMFVCLLACCLVGFVFNFILFTFYLIVFLFLFLFCF